MAATSLHLSRLTCHLSFPPLLAPFLPHSFRLLHKPNAVAFRRRSTFFTTNFSRRFCVASVSSNSDWNNDVGVGDERFDVIVVGGGHAVCEAALASARLGAKTLLLALNLDRIAWQPCNPAVGGHAKSQLVHEVDALGGEIGKVADRSSQERVEKDPVGRIKEKRRPLRSGFGSKKLEYPLIYGVIENCIQGNNSFRKELMTTGDSVLQSNALTGGGYDRMPYSYYGLNKKIKGVCVPAQRQCGMVKFLTKKPKSLRVVEDEANRFPDVMPRKNESVVPDIPHPQKKLNNQSIPRKRNLTKLRKIKRSYRQKHQTRKPSPVSESRRKHLITRKRAPNKFQQANAIVNLLTNKKEKGLDVKRTKGDSFVNQCQPAVHFENYGKNVMLKDMVSRPRKRKRRNYRGCQNDTIFMVCHIGGDLVFCDHCPCSYHLGCMGIKDIPDGKWFCPSCCCGLCGSRYSNSDNQHFTNVCLQCSCEYHVDCLRKAGCLFSTDYPSESFCCEICYKLHVHIR